MKKFTILLVSLMILFLCTSCNYHKGYVYHENTFNEAVQNNCELVELTFNGETHEYVMFHESYQGSVSHWEGCKYCKNKK